MDAEPFFQAAQATNLDRFIRASVVLPLWNEDGEPGDGFSKLATQASTAIGLVDDLAEKTKTPN